MKRCLGCMEMHEDNMQVCPHCGYDINAGAEEAIHMTPGTILRERYIMGKVIGGGGFGVTYIAWDSLLECKVAIKEYLPSDFATRMPGVPRLTLFSGDKAEQFEGGLKRFVEEAKKVAKFQNESGIVKIYDCFEDNRTAYIVMEYLEGVTLSEYLEEVGKLPENVAVQMLMPIINSLRVVHKEGIIHRDIAPDNIMITSDGAIKLIDFGAARYATTSHSRSLTIMIKQGYSPEEQYRSRGEQGPHSDVYALGAVLYRMITGITPPDALERRAYFENGKKDILEPLTKHAKNISANVENAIFNAMNIRIQDRTPDMEVFLSELTSKEVVARRNGRIKKIDMLKWPLWLKVIVPMATAAIVTLFALLGMGIIGFETSELREIDIPDGMTRVPRIVSMQVDEAQKTLEQKQLIYLISGTTYDETIEAGCILLQETNVGSVVPVNSSLKVVISAGIEKKEVPYIVGFEKERAIAELEKDGFAYDIVTTYDSAISEGYVVSQSIEGGSQSDKGTTIVLHISMGRDPENEYTYEQGTMPDLQGLSFVDAKYQCAKYGIKLIVGEYKYESNYKSMDILAQSVEVGAPVGKDMVVEVDVSKGEVTYRVPDLVYQTEEEAINRLEAIGYGYDISYEESATVIKGCVISQNIEANTIQEPGTVIEIVVSLGPPEFDMISVEGQNGEKAIESLRQLGLVVNVNYAYEPNVEEGTVLYQSSKKGEKVYLGYAVEITLCSKNQLVQVSNIVGKSYDDAKKQLEEAGFKIQKNEVYSSTVAKGKVVSQSLKGGSMQTAESKIVVTVSLGKELVSVTLDPNGGTVSGKTINTYHADAYGTLPTPQRQYYTFVGWYTSKEGGSKISKDTVVSSNKAHTLYAHWQVNTVKISFDPNGGSCGESSRTVNQGVKYGDLPVAKRDYYTFKGWYTASSGGTKVTSSSLTGTSNITLYAQWEKNNVSDWVLESQVPAGATIEDVKWTYTLTETATSTSSKESGWTVINSYWKESGSGTVTWANFPSGFDATHSIYTSMSKAEPTAYDDGSSKRVINTTWKGYIYWHWAYDNYVKTACDRVVGHKYGKYKVKTVDGTCTFDYTLFKAFTSNTVYKTTVANGSNGETVYRIQDTMTSYAQSGGSYWWYRLDYYTTSYTDYIKMYTHQRVTNNLESSTAVTASSTISNVKKYVKYRPK